ncbi:SDR family NAD(P)-dependent oxidoreductase [Mangrovicoccus ximenensis]|uniref:SDR family NAD(P)-dependent oxidoreductase n=1 Tax=Mangrovicoccus ximenensis TaxID=1911570 RepID=UPI001374A9C5|nr:SDR family oxidoreductase [Mangrovicoccus ximenensis]
MTLKIALQLVYARARGFAAHSATKAGLISLTRTSALDLAVDGIRAVSLSPGAVMASRLIRRAGSEKEAQAQHAPRHPIGRIGRIGPTAKIAETALFLVSDGAGFIPGSDLPADGGYALKQTWALPDCPALPECCRGGPFARQ